MKLKVGQTVSSNVEPLAGIVVACKTHDPWVLVLVDPTRSHMGWDAATYGQLRLQVQRAKHRASTKLQSTYTPNNRYWWVQRVDLSVEKQRKVV